MTEIRPSDGSVDEQQPLLQQESSERYETYQQTSSSRWKRLWQKILPRFEVVSPHYRYVPLLGCLIIVFNEAESMFKQVAIIRAIEALHCIEYYEDRDQDLAQLGKHIPERFCKIDEIQEHVATTVAFQLLIRLLCSMIGVEWHRTCLGIWTV